MNTILKPVIFASAFLISGCVTCHQGLFQRIEPIPQDQAVVYFYRWAERGGAMSFSYDIYADGNKIGTLDDEEHFAHVASPGKVTFSLEEKYHDKPVTRVLQAGREYYFMIYFDSTGESETAKTLGAVVGGPVLSDMVGRPTPHIRTATSPYEALDALNCTRPRK